MKVKTLALLLVVLGTLVALSMRDSGRSRGSSIVENPHPFEKLDLNLVRSIELTQGGESLKITGSGTNWHAEKGELSFPANYVKIRSTLRSLQEVFLTGKKASDKKFDKNFGLDEASKPMSLKIQGETSTLLELSLGRVRKSKPQGPYNMSSDKGQHLRLSGDEGVYVSQEKVDVNLSSGFWMIKNLVEGEYKKEDISRVKLVHPYKTFSIFSESIKIKKSTAPDATEEEKVVWRAGGQLPPGRALVESAVDGFLTRLTDISLTEPAPASVISKISTDAGYQLTIYRGDDLLADLGAGQIDEDWYIWKKSQTKTVYKMGKWKAEEMFSASGKLFGLNDTTLPISQTTDIEWSLPDHPSVKLHFDPGNWVIRGKEPLPKMDKPQIRKLIDTLRKLDVKDYYFGSFKPAGPVLTLTIKDGEKFVVKDMGKSPTGSNLISYSGSKALYSISDFDRGELFIDMNEFIKADAQPDKLEGIVQVKYPDFLLQKEGEKWKVDFGQALIQQSHLELWFEAYKTLFDSPYDSEGGNFLASKKLTLVDADKKESSVEFSAPENGLVKMHSSSYGGLFLVKEEVVKALFKSKKEFLELVKKTAK